MCEVLAWLNATPVDPNALEVAEARLQTVLDHHLPEENQLAVAALNFFRHRVRLPPSADLRKPQIELNERAFFGRRNLRFSQVVGFTLTGVLELLECTFSLAGFTDLAHPDSASEISISITAQTFLITHARARFCSVRKGGM